jgi:hypothetical protein
MMLMLDRPKPAPATGGLAGAAVVPATALLVVG